MEIYRIYAVFIMIMGLVGILWFTIYAIVYCKRSKDVANPTWYIHHSIALRISASDQYDNLSCDITLWWMIICQEFNLENSSITIRTNGTYIISLNFDSSAYEFDQIKERVNEYCGDCNEIMPIEYRF